MTYGYHRRYVPSFLLLIPFHCDVVCFEIVPLFHFVMSFLFTSVARLCGKERVVAGFISDGRAVAGFASPQSDL